MNRNQFISFFFIGLFVFIVYQLLLILSPFFRAIFWAAILAFAFYPLYLKLRKQLKPHETLAAVLMTTVIFLIVVPPFILIIANVTAQAVDFYQMATAYIREGRLEHLIEQIRTVPFIQRIQTEVFQWEPLKQNAEAWILSSTREIGNFAASQVGTITKNLFFVFLNVAFMFFLLFVFLKDGEEIYGFLYQIAPLESRNKKSIFGQINDTFSAVIRGQLLTALTQAAVAGTLFWMLGLPFPILFAVATFLASLIPVVGASAIWVPLVIYLGLIQAYGKAIILFFFGFLVISLIDNILKPILIGEKTKLPYFLLFFGILGGLKLYGLVGLFLAPVVLSLFFALAKIYQEQYG